MTEPGRRQTDECPECGTLAHGLPCIDWRGEVMAAPHRGRGRRLPCCGYPDGAGHRDDCDGEASAGRSSTPEEPEAGAVVSQQDEACICSSDKAQPEYGCPAHDFGGAGW